MSKIYTNNSSKEITNEIKQLTKKLYDNKQITKQLCNILNKALRQSPQHLLRMIHNEQHKILDDKIESNNNQYKVDRLNAEISDFLNGDLNKYEFLTRKDLNYKPNRLDKAGFEFSPLGKTFSTGLNKTVPNYQEKGVIKLLKDIRDGLAGRINIPSGLIISPPKSPEPPQSPKPSKSPEPPPKDTRLSFDDFNKIKENIPKKIQELNEIKKRIVRIFYMSDDILSDSINIEEMLLAIDYNIIKRLNGELKDNNLSVAESKKINDDIVEKKKYLKENKNYMILKKF